MTINGVADRREEETSPVHPGRKPWHLLRQLVQLLCILKLRPADACYDFVIQDVCEKAFQAGWVSRSTGCEGTVCWSCESGKQDKGGVVAVFYTSESQRLLKTPA